MNFVELHRSFVPVQKDQEPMLDGGTWGRKLGGWLNWSELLCHRRVVLLAEASSGKTEEFRNQEKVLSEQGNAAFFVRIEELADGGFDTALQPGHREVFARWQSSSAEAFFFLDSVDEARLNRKSFETAVKRFARDLGRAIERASVFISCRATDWKVREDRMLIERILPWRDTPAEPENDADPLLDPVFKEREANTARKADKPAKKSKLGDVLVVQLVPLSRQQCHDLAGAIPGVDPKKFMADIRKSGLDTFAERPGDVIDLAGYWKANGHFANLAEMFDSNISRKLTEADGYRPDNELLTIGRAQVGAERVAAAMTLGKSLTLRAPGHESDPSLAAGALDPSQILNDWTDAERNALLRRGIFAPSTYGRVRFHHRSTQEYLTARWLNRCLNSSCPRDEIWNLLFAERYGVKTLVPSLRPTLAWLSLRQPDIRDEAIRREPLVLIRHGDPGSLPLDVKKRLLLAFARKHAEGDISDDSLDYRALWLFSEPQLADAIREAWRLDASARCRFVLLRIIREGRVSDCVDLARQVTQDNGARDVDRLVAVEALVACGDDVGLRATARRIFRNRTTLSPYLASEIAKLVFPKYLNTAELLKLIDAQPHGNGRGGFPVAITELYEQCFDSTTRKAFVRGLVSLCLAKPFADSLRRVSKRHLALATALEPIARREVQALNGRGAPTHVVRLLMAVDRAGKESANDEEESLAGLIQKNKLLQQQLFWAEVDEVRQNKEKGDKRRTRFWQVSSLGPTAWRFGIADVPSSLTRLRIGPTRTTGAWL